MAFNDIKIHTTGGLGVVPTVVWQTEANATAILAGEPVKLKSAGSPYVIPLADNEPTTSTTQVIGVAAKASTHTASADGTCEVYVCSPEMIWEAKATTSANADTTSELNALVGDRVLFDLISSTYTVDENAGDGATNGIQIVGGDADRAVIYFKFRPFAGEAAIA